MSFQDRLGEGEAATSAKEDVVGNGIRKKVKENAERGREQKLRS